MSDTIPIERVQEFADQLQRLWIGAEMDREEASAAGNTQNAIFASGRSENCSRALSALSQFTGVEPTRNK